MKIKQDSLVFIKLKKVHPVPSTASEAVEILPDLKQNLYISNQKELKFLITNSYRSLLDNELKNFIINFFNFISWSFRKKILMIYLVAAFQLYQIH